MENAKKKNGWPRLAKKFLEILSNDSDSEFAELVASSKARAEGLELERKAISDLFVTLREEDTKQQSKRKRRVFDSKEIPISNPSPRMAH